MRKLISIFTIFCFLGACFRLYAQEGVISASPVSEEATEHQKSVISAEEYLLMPGDSILITITGSTNYSYITAVTLEGKITVNMPVSSVMGSASTISPIGLHEARFDIVDAVPMYNITLEAAKDSLKMVFLKYFRRINLDITLLSMRTFFVYVAGEVHKPGIAFARPIDRVSTIIDTIGGVTAIGSRSKIELRRGGKLSKVVDLEEFARTGNTEANPYVQDGDLIYVPRIEKSVIVIGAVYGKREYGLKELEQTIPRKELVVPGERTSEGLYELVEGETVLDIIAKVGVAPWADLTNAYIERGSQTTIMVNLADVIANENSRYNIKMENGDKLYVPLINAVVYVEGQVTNPGSYVFQPNLRTRDYIGFAGGPLAEASMSSIYIQRGKKKISASNNPMIEQGDVIFVPKIFLIFWQDYLEISSVLVTILLSYLTIKAVTTP